MRSSRKWERAEVTHELWRKQREFAKSYPYFGEVLHNIHTRLQLNYQRNRKVVDYYTLMEQEKKFKKQIKEAIDCFANLF